METRISDKKLSIVMPVYNEAEIIEKTVRDYYDFVLKRFDNWEFVIINDCSKDATLDILKGLKKEINITIIENQNNLGHGPSLIRGYKKATGDIILHTDSDYQFDPKDFWKLYGFADSCDFVLGCRDVRHDPFYRIILARILKIFLFLSFRVKIKDVNSPFRTMKRDFLQKFLSILPDNFLVPSVAMSIFAKSKKYCVKEVLVTHLPRKTGKISIMRVKLLVFCYKALRQLMGLRSCLA